MTTWPLFLNLSDGFLRMTIVISNVHVVDVSCDLKIYSRVVDLICLILLMIVLLAIWSLRELVLILAMILSNFVYLIKVWACSYDTRRCGSHIHVCALVATIVASLRCIQVRLLLWNVLCT